MATTPFLCIVMGWQMMSKPKLRGAHAGLGLMSHSPWQFGPPLDIWEGPSAKPAGWRKAKKARTLARFHYAAPLRPPNNWRRGGYFPRKMQISSLWGGHLAERVWVRLVSNLVAILNHAVDVANQPEVCLAVRPLRRILAVKFAE